jgi:uridine kinase
MIISLRGTNSSGKSTVVRGIMERFRPVPLYGVLGFKKPEAYRLELLKKGKPLYILGPYVVPTGGADQVTTKGIDVLIALAEKYHQKGHVLAEGILISNNYGSFGEWLHKYKEEVIVVFMDTPLAVCLESVKRRQVEAGRGEKEVIHLEGHYKRVLSTRKTMEGMDFRTEDVSWDNGVEKILSWLTKE